MFVERLAWELRKEFSSGAIMHAATSLTIAITDRNPHVREFLGRELAGLGHEVSVFVGREALLEVLRGLRPPQVLLLDPEALGTGLSEVARVLTDRPGQVAVVLHVFEGAELQPEFDGALLVEKRPDMSALKAALLVLAAQIHRHSGGEGEMVSRPKEEKP
jgi:CheY-like chemotaxis protein